MDDYPEGRREQKPLFVNGKYNASKLALIIYLNAVRQSRNRWLSCLEIHKNCGLSLSYLRNRLPRFSRWKRPLVLVKSINRVAHYRLASRGINDLPRYDPIVVYQLSQEIAKFQDRQREIQRKRLQQFFDDMKMRQQQREQQKKEEGCPN